ncbi:mitochondrial ribosome-associated GTPase 1 [Babesia caballi]|uniref:Mitochondrial ribosome-associated GTPase 1 n=1 Tax=Babesia caballi TaxID=5871 RepID=A0AAV4LUZ4_BABCB|nr:mitochondrial ribosome-associated GTPase 1 [Babesia caballi]
MTTWCAPSGCGWRAKKAIEWRCTVVLSTIPQWKTGRDSTELATPQGRKCGPHRRSTVSQAARRSSHLAAAQAPDVSSSQRQYVEDGVCFTEFDFLHPDGSAPSRYDPARQQAAVHFHEVDCSGDQGAGAGDAYGASSVAYDYMQMAFIQNDSVTDEVMRETQGMLNAACEKVLQFHMSRRYGGGREEIDRNAAAAMRSIRGLVYWVGGRMLNCAKAAMDRRDSTADTAAGESEVRQKLEERIRALVRDTVEHWENSIRPKKVDGQMGVCPRAKEAGSAEEHVARLWDYLNSAAFAGLLPEFADMRFSWYALVDRNGGVREMPGGELFAYTLKDNVAFPRIAYPRELAGREAALGNCVFRSMLKLYCDVYAPRFGDHNYAEVAIAACQFVESEVARAAKVAFSCVQTDVVGSDPGLRHLVPLLNARDPLRNADADINEAADVFVDTEHLPFFEYRLRFGHLKEAVKDVETALDLFDRSFRPQGQARRDRVADELKRSGVEVEIDDGVSPLKVKEKRDRTVCVGTEEEGGVDVKDEAAGGLDGVWRRDAQGNLTVPMGELQRALVFADLDKFGNILSLGVNDLVALKPVQMNSIQNKVIALCVDALNQVRSLDSYALNYSLSPEVVANEEINEVVGRVNSAVMQCILFLNKLVGRCLAHNGLFPLDSSFLRTRPLESLIREAEAAAARGDAHFGEEALREEQGMKPVFFPEEYLSDAVAADDAIALKFLVNYYNFNLFGGRLPIDIEIRFEPGAVEEYLSSHDDSAEELRAPVVYINPLVARSKPLVARLILEECYHLFLRWAYRFGSGFEGRADVLLTEVVESDLGRRTRRHVANCIEGAGNWPFFFDDLHHMAVYEQEGLAHLASGDVALQGRELENVFKDLLRSEMDVVEVLEGLVKRTMMTELWERRVLPIRHFVNALQGGDYDLAYTVMVNSSSVKALLYQPMGVINAVENKFKDACQISYVLDDKRGQLLGEQRQRANAMANLEALNLVECAFVELREQVTRHSLIAAPDLTGGVTVAMDDLARSMPVEIDMSETVPQCSVMGVNTVAKGGESKEEDLVNRYITPAGSKESGAADVGQDRVPSRDDANAEEYAMDDEERKVFAEAVYHVYNRKLFNENLPGDAQIEFVDNLEDLSMLDDNMHRMAPPIIRVNSLVSDARLLFLNMMVQMVNIAFASSVHSVEMDCVRYLDTSYRSVFKQFHVNQQQMMKRRLLPIRRQSRHREMENANRGVDDEYVRDIKASSKLWSGEGASLLDMEVEEFIDEVLDGREEVRRAKCDESLISPYEEYQTLKAFARHYVDYKSKTLGARAEVCDRAASGSGVDKDLRLINNQVLRAIWSRFKFEQVEKALRCLGIEMPLSGSLELNWQQLLDEEQQFKMTKYLTLHASEDNMFTMLVRSGACSPAEAWGLLVKMADPHLKLEPEGATGDGAAGGQGSFFDEDLAEGGLRMENSPLFKDLQGLLGGLDQSTADVVRQVVDKLLQRNYVHAMGTLNFHPNRSYLKEVAVRYLDILRNHGVVDNQQYREVADMLRG